MKYRGIRIPYKQHRKVSIMQETIVKLSSCPRCGTRLTQNHYEPECVTCGWQDYSGPVARVKTASILHSATRFVVRYGGPAPALANTVTRVKLVRVDNHHQMGVSCPFCAGEMNQTSLPGNRRDVQETRYECYVGHRVSLTQDADQGLYWK